VSPRRALGSFAVLIVVSLCAPAAAAAAPVGDCQAGVGWPAALPAPATELVDRANAHRAERGVAPLAVSPTLTAAAEWKARHMAYYGYMEHDDPAPPVRRTAFQRLEACGYPGQSLTGENIAAGYDTPASVMEAWLGSPDHRANLELPEFRAIGAGVARTDQGTYYWALDLGSVADAALPPTRPPAPVTAPPPPAPGPDPGPSVGVALGPAAPVRARGCRRRTGSRRAVRCRLVVLSAPVTVRARLRQHGVVVASGAVHADRVGPLSLRMRARPALRPGPGVLRLRAGGAIVRRPVRVR
jgi:uncharacterized protein YkwD